MWIVLVTVVGVSALLVAVLGVVHVSVRRQRRQIAAFDCTHRELHSFADCLLDAGISRGHLPQGPFERCLGELRHDPRYRARLSSECPVLARTGRDGWGRKYEYLVGPSGMAAVVRSTGANGNDEGGKGDDLERSVTIPEELWR